MKSFQKPTKAYGLSLAQELSSVLQQEGYPVRGVFLFGSVARDTVHDWSDIDIAVVCDPFLESRYAERDIFSSAARLLDVRIELVCLHPSDFANKYWRLPREVQEYGIAA